MKRGFTLIELLVVVGIMAFLGVAATGGYNALQRGMAERGATEAASKLFRAALERALVDRSPTAVFCYNKLLRAADDENNAVVVGEAVAIRRAGRITWAQGNYLVDEFADAGYDIVNESEMNNRGTMKLWCFDDSKMGAMKYSLVADALCPQTINGQSYQGWAEGDTTKNKAMQLPVYAFLVKQSVGGPTWNAGQGYGLEFNRVQLPHNFVFGNGALPTRYGDQQFVRAFYFEPENPDLSQSIEVQYCTPNSSGQPQIHNKAGDAKCN